MRFQTIYQIAIRPRRVEKKNLTFVTITNKETKEKESTLATQTALGETGRVKNIVSYFTCGRSRGQKLVSYIFH